MIKIIKKNNVVCNNKPLFVGQPLSSDILIYVPYNFCKNWYSAGEETKKKIIAEKKEYLNFLPNVNLSSGT
jgi:hypothetical protein